jgi:hypothetical protein
MLPPASSLPAAVLDDAANAVEKLGTASANANPIIHPMFNLRIGIFLLVEYLVQARSRSFAVKQTVPRGQSA